MRPSEGSTCFTLPRHRVGMHAMMTHGIISTLRCSVCKRQAGMDGGKSNTLLVLLCEQVQGKYQPVDDDHVEVQGEMDESGGCTQGHDVPAAALLVSSATRRCVNASLPSSAELLNVVPRHSSGIDLKMAPMNGWNSPGAPDGPLPTPPAVALILVALSC